MDRSDEWQPWTPDEVAGLWPDGSFPWWIAGGYAMDHAAQRRIRDHGDIDVLVLRRDEAVMRRSLDRWECFASVAGVLTALRPADSLPVTVHDLWYRAGPTEPWRFQVMIDEAIGDRFASRRDARVTYPVDRMGSWDVRVCFLVPEIQLYYKAKAPLWKDEIDFAAVLPHLSGAARAWLMDAIAMTYGEGHPWVRQLS